MMHLAQDYRLERKWSAVGFCSGAIAGLVAITPASGFVGSRECHIAILIIARQHTEINTPQRPHSFMDSWQARYVTLPHS